MLWVGLTGGIGSGKSTVARMMHDLGLPVADADAFVREALHSTGAAFAEVIQAFGRDILNANGEIDRSQLGKIVFASKQNRERLESIVHPFVRAAANQFRDRCEKSGAPIAVYEIPLLFEKKLETEFDRTIVVSCSTESQIDRTMQRNQLSRADVEARIKSQIPVSEKVKRAHYVIANDAGLDELKKQTKKCVDWLRGQANT